MFVTRWWRRRESRKSERDCDTSKLRRHEEFQRLKEADLVLRFHYPTAEQRENLRIVHRGMGGADQTEVGRSLA